MKPKIHLRALRLFLIIMGTAVVVMNLTVLIPTNPEYSASWLKVVFAAGLVILGANLPTTQ